MNPSASGGGDGPNAPYRGRMAGGPNRDPRVSAAPAATAGLLAHDNTRGVGEVGAAAPVTAMGTVAEALTLLMAPATNVSSDHMKAETSTWPGMGSAISTRL